MLLLSKNVKQPDSCKQLTFMNLLVIVHAVLKKKKKMFRRTFPSYFVCILHSSEVPLFSSIKLSLELIMIIYALNNALELIFKKQKV